MWRSKDKDEEIIQCPVCRSILGRLNKDLIFAEHCEECKATFTWQPGETKPTVKMDKDIKKIQYYCGKNGCYCRS